MQLDWLTFNFLEFIAAFILALLIWAGDKKFVKPKIKVRVGNPSILFDGNFKTLNLGVVNEKRGGILVLFNHVATQVRIHLHFLDYPSRAEFNDVIARWNSSREPVTPDYKNVDTGLALTNPREVLVPGQPGEISVVIRKRDSQFCFPFNNESYLHKDYSKPQWEIKDDKFIVRVEFKSAEVHETVGEFIVLNKGTIDQFKIAELEK